MTNIFRVLLAYNHTTVLIKFVFFKSVRVTVKLDNKIVFATKANFDICLPAENRI